jgi:hypothetical protein
MFRKNYLFTENNFFFVLVEGTGQGSNFFLIKSSRYYQYTRRFFQLAGEF